MIKTSNTGYVTLKNGEPAIPLGKTRTNEHGETEALVLAFMQTGIFRDIWIQRKDIR